MTSKKVLLICGTRPEIIKMAPVWKALQATPVVTPVLLHTGQHTDMATPLYAFFDMPPTITLDLSRKDPSLTHLNALLLEKIGAVLLEQRPDAVLVHGDTSSAMMGAMAAFFQQIPVGHVEAGLRTGEMYSPFPEEMNRSIIGRIAQWHYAPTKRAGAALTAENINPQNVLTTGNTVIDAARLTARLLESSPEPFWQDNDLANRTAGKKLVLVTAHRRENWGAGLEQIAHAACDILESQHDVVMVWPLHANPAVANTVREVFAARAVPAERAILCAPLDYKALIKLLTRSFLTLTDSGGIQEEAAAFGVPVLVLRDSTERPELIDAGGGLLTGADRAVIVAETKALLGSPSRHAAMANIENPFGDGTAATQIVSHLLDSLQISIYQAAA